MASWSGLIHSACFFFVGLRLWSFGKRYGYRTQIQYFRARFESDAIGYFLFPILVLLVVLLHICRRSLLPGQGWR